MITRILFILVALFTNFKMTFAEWEDLWVFWNDSGLTSSNLRNWEIHSEDIPKLIISATDFLLWIAGTISIIFIIVWAYQYLFGSLSQQKTAWRDTIIMALVWFWIATLSYFLIRVITDNVWDFIN